MTMYATTRFSKPRRILFRGEKPDHAEEVPFTPAMEATLWRALRRTVARALIPALILLVCFYLPLLWFDRQEGELPPVVRPLIAVVTVAILANLAVQLYPLSRDMQRGAFLRSGGVWETERRTRQRNGQRQSYHVLHVDDATIRVPNAVGRTLPDGVSGTVEYTRHNHTLLRIRGDNDVLYYRSPLADAMDDAEPPDTAPPPDSTAKFSVATNGVAPLSRPPGAERDDPRDDPKKPPGVTSLH